eukprot:m.238828 g.238828  ORF g.238828 m.238828 type:complete len:615 (+) comp33730_c0_seq9:54-1898(+)
MSLFRVLGISRRQSPRAALAVFGVVAVYLYLRSSTNVKALDDLPPSVTLAAVVDSKIHHIRKDTPPKPKKIDENDPSIIRSTVADVLPGVDDQHLHGILGLLPDGTPGWHSKPLKEPETLAEKRLHHTQTCFNLAKSDSLDLNRDVPDVRAEGCKERLHKMPPDLPDTSVVFVFFNEPLSPLFRSIHSVLNRTPPRLLKEIILVDDGSDAAWLQKPLEDYIKLLPKVVLKRMGFRQGLMGTREEGARIATAETVTFLDAHIECNVGWLEPMLYRVHQDRRHAVMPIIDSIEPDNFRYHAGGLDILAFSWSLGQKGMSRIRSRLEPNPSPVMAGGLFTIDRALFFELGGYDPEMKLYGGEEMEISFRLWQCGNTLECIPCSRVGHVFRTGKYWQGQVYPVPGDVIIKNKLRASYMWLDEYAEIAHNVMGDLPKGKVIGDLSWGKKIRKTCLNGGPSHNFSWFLKNVYPEMTDVLGMSQYTGEIRNPESHGCLDTLGHHTGGGFAGVYPCHGQHGTQEFLFGKDGQIRIALADYTSCITSDDHTDNVRAHYCGIKENSEAGFEYAEDVRQLVDKHSRKCLTTEQKQTAGSPFTLVMRDCRPKDNTQVWVFGKGHKS